MSVSPSQIFLLLAILLAIGEVFVPGFILLPMAGAFLLTAPFAYFFESTALQLSVLAVNNLIFLVFIRKACLKGQSSSSLLTGAESMVGKTGTVEEAIKGPEGRGYVKIYGDSWVATTPTLVTLPVGAKVEVIGLDGNKIIVKPHGGGQ